MKPELNIRLESECTLLRPLSPDDEAELQLIANDESLWIYGISDKKTNRIAGCTRLADISWKEDRGQIGLTWIGHDFQGSGLNKDMKFLILNYGFDKLGLNRIEFKADELNHKSRQALIGIGATREGVLREHMKLHTGYIRNTVIYSILKSEWDTIKMNYFTNFTSV